jgi:hypothetical protein
VIVQPDKDVIKIVTEKNNPIRAANNLGPAFISLGFTFSPFTIPLDIRANRLQDGFSRLRARKSSIKNTTGSKLDVNTKTSKNRTVKNPFHLATLSSIFLKDIGQKG